MLRYLLAYSTGKPQESFDDARRTSLFEECLEKVLPICNGEAQANDTNSSKVKEHLMQYSEAHGEHETELYPSFLAMASAALQYLQELEIADLRPFKNDNSSGNPSRMSSYPDLMFRAIDEEDGNSSEPDRGCPQRFRYGVDPDDTRCAGTDPFMALQLLNKAVFQGNIPHVYEHDAESFIWILVWIALRYTNGNLKGDHDRPLNEWATVDPTRCREKKTDFLTNSEMRDRLLVKAMNRI
ncbi:hypothetical protein L210DRAFT_1061430, partial [Boletus edulis BED1]